MCNIPINITWADSQHSWALLRGTTQEGWRMILKIIPWSSILIIWSSDNLIINCDHQLWEPFHGNIWINRPVGNFRRDHPSEVPNLCRQNLWNGKKNIWQQFVSLNTPCINDIYWWWRSWRPLARIGHSSEQTKSGAEKIRISKKSDTHLIDYFK